MNWRWQYYPDAALSRGGFSLLLAIILVAGCESRSEPLDEALVSLGLADPEPLPARTIDVLVDATPGSPGSSLATVIEEVRRDASAIAERPGSLLRVWILGTSTDEARVLLERRVPARSGSFRSRAASSFADEVAAAASSVLEPALAAGALARVSPIASSIERVFLADVVGTDRVLVIIGDGRERAAGVNLECGDVSPRRFRAALDRHGALTTGSVGDVPVRVEFARFAMLALRGRGCRSTVARERAIRDAWTEVLTDAGVTSVGFRSGSAELEFPTESTFETAAEEE